MCKNKALAKFDTREIILLYSINNCVTGLFHEKSFQPLQADTIFFSLFITCSKPAFARLCALRG